jgi:hypothetical protein
MEHSPSWEHNSRSSSQDIPRLLWSPNVHYSVTNSSQPASILTQINPIHTFTPYLLKSQFNIIFPSCLDLLNSFFHSGFPTKIL